MITVFYDSKCGLCSKEINHYRSIAPTGVFDWQDITESMDGLNRLGVSLTLGLKRLHVLDNHGSLHIGVNAFIVIWRHLPRWRLLAILIALPGIRQLAQYAYASFADWKFKRAKHCQLAATKEPG